MRVRSLLLLLPLSLAAAGCLDDPGADEGGGTPTPTADPCSPAPRNGTFTGGAPQEPAGNATLGGRRATMTVFVWRDFMPGPDAAACGSHLLLVADVRADGEEPLPDDVRPRMAWVVRGDGLAWAVPVEAMEGDAENATRARADGGPRWEVGEEVQVVLLVETLQGMVRFEANTTIERTV